MQLGFIFPEITGAKSDFQLYRYDEICPGESGATSSIKKDDGNQRRPIVRCSSDFRTCVEKYLYDRILPLEDESL